MCSILTNATINFGSTMQEEVLAFMRSFDLQNQGLATLPTHIPLSQFLDICDTISRLIGKTFKFTFNTPQRKGFLAILISHRYHENVAQDLPELIRYGAILDVWRVALSVVFGNKKANESNLILVKIYHAYGENAFLAAFRQFTGRNYSECNCNFILQEEQRRQNETSLLQKTSYWQLFLRSFMKNPSTQETPLLAREPR